VGPQRCRSPFPGGNFSKKCLTPLDSSRFLRNARRTTYVLRSSSSWFIICRVGVF
jgi:hypothetical protein